MNKKTEAPHMGQLLKRLSVWYNKGDIPFAKAVGISQKSFYKFIKDERLTPKNIIKISRAMNIPENYFEGKFELPVNVNPSDKMSEANIKVVLLESENLQLRKELNDLQRKHIELHEKYNKLSEEKNSFA